VTNPLISVLVLTHNTRELVLNCLSGFYDEAVSAGWQIIVVDNASTDGTAEAIRQAFSLVELIRSERNLGFAGGNNLGLHEARGEVVCLLNADVKVTGATLRGLAETLMACPEVGAISAGLVTPDGEPQPFAFGADPRMGYLIWRGLRALLGLGPMHRWDVDQPIETDWVSGACLCVRQQVIRQVGLLDERFFLYFEDNDWCLRMRRAGWRVVYDPRFRVVHYGGASQPQRGLAATVYRESLLKFYAKHYGLLMTLLLRLFLIPYQWALFMRQALGQG